MEGYLITGVGYNAKATIVKDPDAVLDYPFDWSEWLDAVEDTIATEEIIAEAGIVCDSSSLAAGNKIVTAWISGGSAGETYRVTCRITTVGAREDDRSIFIKVQER